LRSQSSLNGPLRFSAIRFVGVVRSRPTSATISILDFDTVLTATLTLLALIIGFSFSMAVTRYDQRKNYEAAEANAIGTAYLRADLLPADTAASVRLFLKLYVQQRVNFFNSNGQPHQEVAPDPAKLHDELWSSVVGAAGAQPNAVLALAVSGMNDVFNSQADTMAAWLNRIPTGAWVICCWVIESAAAVAWLYSSSR
jgi:hypothetical protein